jgi:hypothetical protein
MSITNSRTTVTTSPLYPAVAAVMDSFRPALAQNFDAFKMRLDLASVMEAAHEELNVLSFLRSQGYDMDALSEEEEELRADSHRVIGLVMSAWNTECEQLARAFRDLHQRTSAVLREQVRKRGRLPDLATDP